MKKGFTLIELLIVMIVVGILVTITLPKYNASLERGRAMEAITNLKAASDTVNAHYIIDGNAYKCAGVFGTGSNSQKFVSPEMFTKGESGYGRYFNEPQRSSNCTDNASSVSIVTSRVTGDYTLTAYNENGELKYITCTANDTQICEGIGAEPITSGGNTVYRLEF